jgi:hypothetical protein
VAAPDPLRRRRFFPLPLLPRRRDDRRFFSLPLSFSFSLRRFLSLDARFSFPRSLSLSFLCRLRLSLVRLSAASASRISWRRRCSAVSGAVAGPGPAGASLPRARS